MTFIIFSSDHIIRVHNTQNALVSKKHALGNIIMMMSFFPCQK